MFLGCAANDTYSLPLGIMLHSVCSHMSHPENLTIFLVDGGISEPNKARIRRTVEPFGCPLEFLAPLKIDIKRKRYLTQEATYRLMLPTLLPDVDRIIYLDCDVLVFDDLMKLWGYPCDFIGAAVDLLTPDFKDQILDHQQSIDSVVGPAFNSGVLLLNLAALRSTQAMDECFSLLTGPRFEQMAFMDQSALNCVFHSSRNSIPLEWNFPSNHLKVPLDEVQEPRLVALSSCGDDYLRAQTHVKIIHFMGPKKPWMPQCEFSQTRIFLRELNASAWFDSSFQRTLWHIRFQVARWIYQGSQLKFSLLDLERGYWRTKMRFKRKLGWIKD